MSPVFPHGDRVVRGNCYWQNSPDAEVALKDLRKIDSFALGDINGQIVEAVGRGLGRSRYTAPRDYRCPLAFAPFGEPDPPWLGELKAGGRKGLEWRLYFGEPINFQYHVVGLNLRDSKRSGFSVLQNRNRQRGHVVQAMRYLRKFFKQEGYEWAPFPVKA